MGGTFWKQNNLPFAGQPTPMRFACRSDRKSGRIKGYGAFRAIRLATRAARVRRGDSQEENRGFSSWVVLFCNISLTTERKVNKNT